MTRCFHMHANCCLLTLLAALVQAQPHCVNSNQAQLIGNSTVNSAFCLLETPSSCVGKYHTFRTPPPPSENPFDGIDVGLDSAPAFADGTGTKRCVGICNEHTMLLYDLVCVFSQPFIPTNT